MINGLGYKLANVPTITGLSTVTADRVISDLTTTEQLIVDGVDISSEIGNQKARIIILEDKTTGITYDDTGDIDLTTIDNNVTITTGKILTVDGINVNTTLTQVATNTSNITALQQATTGITYNSTGDLTTIDNNVTITTGKTLTVNGVDVATAIAQVPINTADIADLQQATTGITYNSTGDLTTIDNNVTITTGKKLKTATVPTASDDVVNKTYADTKVSLTANQTIDGFKTFSEGVVLLDTLSFTSASQGKRQINNTFYNLYDNSAVASGVYMGRLFSNANNVFIEFGNLTHAFKVNNSAGNLLTIDSTTFNTTTTNNPTISGYTDPSPGNSSNNIATTRWVQSAIAAGSGSATTIAVADNNTNTTMYPVFCTAGAGQKSLLFDTTTTPLSYNPLNGVLRTKLIGFPTTVESYIGVASSATDIVIENNNIGGKIDCLVNTSGLPLVVLSASEINTTIRSQTNIEVGNGTAGTTPYLQITENGAAAERVSFIPLVTASSYNSLVQLNDALIYGANTPQNKCLTISSWSSTTTGVRITPVSVMIGAGGTGVTPTSAIDLSGTTVDIIGNPSVRNRNIVVNSVNGNQGISMGTGGTPSNSCLIIANVGNQATTNNFTIASAGNTVVGVSAGQSITTTNFDDTYVGHAAGVNCSGSSNTFIGKNAGSTCTTGSNNTCLGSGATVPTPAGSNQIAIGDTSSIMFIRGGFNIRIGTLITNNITLPSGVLPLAQHYPVAMSVASCVITLPAPGGVAYLGALVTFKRRTNTTAFTITTVGGGANILTSGSITPIVTFSVTTTIYQLSFCCDGTNWCIISTA